MDSSRLKSQSREAWSQFVSLVTMDLKIAKNQKQRGKKGGGEERKEERKKTRDWNVRANTNVLRVGSRRRKREIKGTK